MGFFFGGGFEDDGADLEDLASEVDGRVPFGAWLEGFIFVGGELGTELGFLF